MSSMTITRRVLIGAIRSNTPTESCVYYRACKIPIGEPYTQRETIQRIVSRSQVTGPIYYNHFFKTVNRNMMGSIVINWESD